MKRVFCIFALVLWLAGIAHAESIDISDDLQKNIQAQPAAQGGQNLNFPRQQSAAGAGDTEMMTDIYDIKPLEEIGYDTRLIKYAVIILIAVILLCLLIYLIDYYLRRRKKESTEDVIIIPADIEANQLLETLIKSDLSPREYYFGLTAILKGYIGRRFDFDAPEMTTEELLPRLNELDCEKKLISDVKAVLTSTDPVKYAGADVLTDKMETDFQTVKDFVRLTPLPIEEPEKEEKDV